MNDRLTEPRLARSWFDASAHSDAALKTAQIDSAPLEITGYSERGALNALLYEMAYSSASLQLCKRLFGLAHFPGGRQIGAGFTRARILIEQSFSDFGDADAVFLLDGPDGSAAVFLEAKVQASAGLPWTLNNEFKRFKDGCLTARKLSSSNLFTQLYHKARLVGCLRNPGWEEALSGGLSFPGCSTKACRRIGSNRVVLSAVREVEKYSRSVWFLSLVPDTDTEVTKFFDSLPSRWPSELGRLLDEDKWGGVAWERITEFCDAYGLKNAQRVLEFNREQVCLPLQRNGVVPPVGL